MRRVTPFLLATLTACASGGVNTPPAPQPQSRYIIQPSEGEHLTFCDTPELSVAIPRQYSF